MSKVDNDPHGENTNVIVNSMRKQRHSMRVPIIVGTVGIAGLIGIMALGLGSKREDSYKIDATKPGGEVHQMLSADGHDAQTRAQFGLVEVHLKSGGSLLIDGENHGSAANHSLKLEVGPHTLVNKRKAGPSISQMVTVLSDKTLDVVFEKKKVRVTEVEGVRAP